MKKKVKKIKSRIFVQKANPYRYEILVSVGATGKQVARFLAKGSHRKYVEENLEYFDEIIEGKFLGRAIHVKQIKFMALVLPRFKNEWDYYESLIHELNHIVYFISDDRTFKDEMEAQAYLQEHLFHEIRRKIQLPK